MLQFDVGGLVRLYGKLVEDVAIYRGESGQLDSGTKSRLEERLLTIQEYAGPLELDAVIAAGGQFIRRLGKSDKPPMTYSEVATRLEELRRRIKDQLQGKLFMFIPIDKVRYFGQTALFGDAVKDRFPDASEDIAEAGNCFAAGRWTASVFHLMRTMERGVQAFADRLGVGDKTIFLREWGAILGKFRGKIDAIHPKTRKTKSRKEAYSEAWVFLYRAKDAWRNRTMHPKATYTEQEAKEVLDASRAFMGRLAGIL